MLLQGKETPYDTELFVPVMDKLLELTPYKENIKSRRIVTEHLRASMMVISDGGRPSNIDRGYILRRLIRRMVRHLNKLEINLNELSRLVDIYIDTLGKMYPDLVLKKEEIKQVIIDEKDKFVKTLEHGQRELEKVLNRAKQENKTILEPSTVFNLYETYGFPPEVTKEIAEEQGYLVDLKEIDKLFKEHQEKSKLGSDKKFKGGLSGSGEMETKYHTATHLLNAALKVVLGPETHQAGSNITPERMRFDFPCDHKLTDEEKRKIEDLINEWIEDGLTVTNTEMKKEDAVATGAEAMFIERYPDIVTVYTIGDVSKEICMGPHVENTKVLGHFKIQKEEASSAGIRRIKAVLIN